MEEVRVKMAFAKVKFHARILWRGFWRTVFGTAVTTLIAAAIFCFVSVPKETGWAAVCDFIVASVLLIEALRNMYFMGRGKNGSARGKERR